MAKALGLKTLDLNMVFEGGSIEVNGAGSCLLTEECMLHPNRNPKLNRNEIEEHLRKYLGVRHFIWLNEGIEGDDTDGHVDEIARFVSANTVLVSSGNHSSDPNDQTLLENRKILDRSVDQNGKKLNVIGLPSPERITHDGQALPASYANFYVGNQVVLVPIFGDSNDTKAVSILKSVFSSRTVIGIPVLPLLYGQGAIHCITQQEPTA